eukprot:scaffold61877_cov30-Prasinocladus_malaysianus.AAC.1
MTFVQCCPSRKASNSSLKHNASQPKARQPASQAHLKAKEMYTPQAENSRSLESIDTAFKENVAACSSQMDRRAQLAAFKASKPSATGAKPPRPQAVPMSARSNRNELRQANVTPPLGNEHTASKPSLGQAQPSPPWEASQNHEQASKAGVGRHSEHSVLGMPAAPSK